MKCEKCQVDYPTGLVSTIHSSAGTNDLCGVCALEVVAEAIRQSAIKYREKIGYKDGTNKRSE